jgi:ribosomal protein S18 acetylase RimI-like enzyme
MHVRPATTVDIADMHRIRVAVRENRLVSVQLSHADYARRIASSWVATRDARIVGFAVADVDGASANIWALFVDPAHERTGVGRALHDAMLSAVFAAGVTHAWLTTAPTTRAAGFYRAAGWIEIGVEPSGELRFELRRSFRAGELHE